MRFEVTYTRPGQESPVVQVTDAAGLTELVHEAAATGVRVHIRPLPED